MTTRPHAASIKERILGPARRLIGWTMTLGMVVALILVAVWHFAPERPSTPAFLEPPERTLTLAVGQVSKEYPRAGGILADVVNIQLQGQGLRLVVQPTPGSHHNLEALITGAADLGFVQGQVLYPGARDDQSSRALRRRVRVIGQVFMSMMTLLATDESGIQTLEDLRGKRVGVHSLTSTDGKSLIDLLDAAALKIRPTSDASPAYTTVPPSPLAVGPSETDANAAVTVVTGETDRLSTLLKRRELDAVFAAISHPSEWARHFLISSELHLVPLVLDLNALRKRSPAYQETSLASSAYPLSNLGVDVTSVGSWTLLVVSENMPDADARLVTQALVEGVQQLKKRRTFQDVTAASLLEGVPPEDLHPGAREVYQEKRLLAPMVSPPPTLETRGLSLVSTEAAGTVTSLVERLNRDHPGQHAGSRVPRVDAPSPLIPPTRQMLLNHLAAGEYELGLLPATDEGFDSGFSQSTDRSGAVLIPWGNLRSICRVPGEVAQLAIATDTGAYAMRDLSARRLGYSGTTSVGLRGWIDGQLMAMDLPPPEWISVSPETWVSRYASLHLDGFLDFSLFPSLEAKTADTVRPLRLVSLDSLADSGPNAGGPRGLEPVLLSAPDTPGRSGVEILSWMRPLELLSSSLVKDAQIATLTAELHRTVSPGLLLRGGALLDARWQGKGRRFPRHAGASRFESALETEPVGTLAKPPVSMPVDTSLPEEKPPSLLLFAAGRSEGSDYAIAAGLVEFFGAYCRERLTLAPPCPPGMGAALVPAKDDVASVELLASGKAGFALVPADLVVQALGGEGPWTDRPLHSLRAVAALYISALTVLASSRETLIGAHVSGGGALKSGERRPKPGEVASIRDLQDLEGRRVSMRHAPGSGPRSNAITLFNRGIFDEKLWQYSLLPGEPPPMEASRLFMDGSIVALFLMAAHPDGFVTAMLQRNSDMTVLPVTGLDAHLEDTPFLTRTTIDLSTYGDALSTHRLIPTVGIPILLMTNEETPAAEVEMLLSTLVLEAELLRKAWPVLTQMTPAFMQSTAGIPLHDAAASVYAEAGRYKQVRR
ncbi:MAG: TAXI family TRAP transporter solute-binding subunit [Myxococcota bacterium]